MGNDIKTGGNYAKIINSGVSSYSPASDACGISSFGCI